MPSAEISELSGIPEEILVQRFGLIGKHIAAEDEHVSDMSVQAAQAMLEAGSIDPASLDAVVYFGSTWKEYPVWQAAPHIAHRIGGSNAFALKMDYVSCGSPVVLRVARDLLRAEPELNKVLVVAAARESYLLDYRYERARFNFGDGAVAGLLEGDTEINQLLGAHIITDGSFSMDVKVPAGGSVEPASTDSVASGRHTLYHVR